MHAIARTNLLRRWFFVIQIVFYIKGGKRRPVKNKMHTIPNFAVGLTN